MSMSADNNIDFIVKIIDDIHDRSGDPYTAIVRSCCNRSGLCATFMDQNNNCFNSFGLQLWYQSIDRCSFIQEVQLRNARRAHDERRAFERHTYEGDLGTIK